MSGTSIPMGGIPVDVVDQYQKWGNIGQTAANTAQTQAQTGQTQAQTGLIGEQTQAANIQNRIAGARLPFLMNAYGSGGGGGASGGAPGAIGATAGQDWTGPGGSIMDPSGPFSQLGALPHGMATDLMLAPPEKWAEVASKAREDKNAYVNQAVAATLDPQSGKADPDKWNAMVQSELAGGWMAASQARSLYGHPEMAQTLLNSTLPPNEQPGTKGAQTTATEGAKANFDLVKTNVPILDENGQPTGQTQEAYVPKSSLTGTGQAAPGATGMQYGPPVQATDLPPTAQKFLRALSPSESSGANIRYVPPGSGRSPTFDTSQGHPGQGAAGLFQFEPATWQRAAQLAGVDPGNMSQANQERGAWALAQDDYAKNSGGRSLQFDLNRGNYAQVAQGLNTTWPSITGGSQSEHNKVGQTFVPRLAAIMGQQGAGTGAVGAGGPAAAGGGAASPGGTPVAAAGPPTFTPGVEASQKIDTPLIAEDQKTNQANQEAATKANAAGVGIREARDLIANVPTGAFIDQRVQLQSIAKQTGIPLLADLATKVTGLNSDQLNDAEFARKLYQANVVKEEQAVGGARIGAMFTNFFAKASPNLSLQNGALTQMTNAALVGQQMTRDYANGSNEHMQAGQEQYQAGLTGGKYTPWPKLGLSNYEQTWTNPGSPHSSDTYAAAVHLLNGADITQTIKGLNPAQVQEAIGVISRADPGAMPKLLARPDIIAWRRSLAPQQAQPTQQAAQ